jgi:hypothetical protein
MAYLIAHLKVDPQAADITPSVEAAAAALKTQNEDWTSKRHAVEEAQAGLVSADEILHNVVRAAHNVILDDVGHTRHSPKFLTYFPRGLAVVIRVPYVDELRTVRALAERCTQDPSPKIQEQAGLLRTAADQVNAAFDRRSEALVAESASYGQLQVQKLATIETCRSAGYRLAELYPNDWDRVRSYFRRIYHRSRSAATAVEETTPGKEETTPATATAATATPVAPALVLAPAGANP